MRLSFDTIEEVLGFVERLKKSRGTKGQSDDEPAQGQAPAPLQPPVGGPAFNPPGAGPTFNPPAAFPGPGNTLPTADPAIAALVGRISARMDAIIQSGQTKAEDMLGWFRTQITQAGFPEAGQATLDQIKGAWLAKLSQPTLDTIAKTIAA